MEKRSLELTSVLNAFREHLLAEELSNDAKPNAAVAPAVADLVAEKFDEGVRDGLGGAALDLG